MEVIERLFEEAAQLAADMKYLLPDTTPTAV